MKHSTVESEGFETWGDMESKIDRLSHQQTALASLDLEVLAANHSLSVHFVVNGVRGYRTCHPGKMPNF